PPPWPYTTLVRSRDVVAGGDHRGARAVHHRQALDGGVLLPRDGNAVEGAEGLAAPLPFVRRAGLGPGAGGVEGLEGVEDGVEFLDAPEEMFGDLHRGQLPA